MLRSVIMWLSCATKIFILFHVHRFVGTEPHGHVSLKMAVVTPTSETPQAFSTHQLFTGKKAALRIPP